MKAYCAQPVWAGHCPSGVAMLTIGQLGRLAAVSPDTLRYYQNEGLLQPDGKSAAGYRLYTAAAAQRIRFIKHAQECGFSLAEIRELLTLRHSESACCGDVRRLAVEKKLLLEHKIRAMQAMSTALDRLITDCNDEAGPVDDCPILAALDQADAPAPPRGGRA
ncbi:heavy metal-responsive transcriptional regulator [Pseudomonas benzenivorans]|uniref:Heavy metal-responsive transcriptional regulator n=1 Tax=Pseudomonas benzenivorans TaxID=556533 RepID=A0ABY5HA42_9PSED|nr:heavy metal-responsive transcriptional regulator [Pseudomonas benzenivorans]UTW08934.1 heavy metal-responsive transcriptional regulator [Pseudomonas benzenivorans]